MSTDHGDAIMMIITNTVLVKAYKHHVLITINVFSLIAKKTAVVASKMPSFPPFHHHWVVHCSLSLLSICFVHVGQGGFQRIWDAGGMQSHR